MQPVAPEATISLAAYSTAASGDAIWATTQQGLARIDPATNAVTAQVKLGSGDDEIDGIAATTSAVWVADFDLGTVYRVDPKTGALKATIKVGEGPEMIKATDDAVWVSNHDGGSVSRIDPATNQVVATISVSPTGADGPYGLVVAFGSVWVGNAGNLAAVVRIDAKTNNVLATIPVTYPNVPCGGIVATLDAIWISGCHSATTMVRIDPKTNSVAASLNVGAYTDGPFVVDDAVWFPLPPHAFERMGGLVRINAATNQMDKALGVGDEFVGDGTSLGFGSVWMVEESGSNTIGRFPLSALTAP